MRKKIFGIILCIMLCLSLLPTAVFAGEPLEITLQPESINAVNGETASFHVAVTGGVEPYAYQWQSLSQGFWTDIESSLEAAGVRTDTLDIRVGNGNDWTTHEEFRCVISDPFGAAVTTNSVKITLAEAAPEPENEYDLWLGETRVTDKNKNDILGDGTARYDSAANILYLNNLNLTEPRFVYESEMGRNIIGISADSRLTINLSGNNTIDLRQYRNIYSVWGIRNVNYTMWIEGSGTLNVYTGNSVSTNSAIEVNALILSGNAAVTVQPGFTSSATSCGVDATIGVILKDNSSLIASADLNSPLSFGVSVSHGVVEVTGGSLTASAKSSAVACKADSTLDLSKYTADHHVIVSDKADGINAKEWDGQEKLCISRGEAAKGVHCFSYVHIAPGEADPLELLTTPFTDVPKDAYYYDATVWAYNAEPQITDGNGKDKFMPEQICTRGQVVTFLWRSAGEPEPKSMSNPFTDVKSSDYFYKPVLWAVEQGITDGTSPDKFSPNNPCKNSHILTFIWRALGKPGDTGNAVWYQDAWDWAEKNHLLDGTYTGTFDINALCPRKNVVQYLYVYYNMK